MTFLERFWSSSVRFELPEGAAIRRLRMLDCAGKDLVARHLARSGWRSFEKPMPEHFLRACASTGGLVLDVGANTGFYALLAAAARKDVRVIAFEPDPAVKPILDRNVRINWLDRRVTTLPVAVSDRPGFAELFIPLQDHGLVEKSSSLDRTFKTDHSRVLRVETDTIDAFCRQLRGLPDVTVIKVDVEGHETAVLGGAAATIRKHRPLLFVEVLPRADLPWLGGFLREHGYRDLPLRTSGPLEAGDRVAFDPDAWNHLFVPAERADRFV